MPSDIIPSTTLPQQQANTILVSFEKTSKDNIYFIYCPFDIIRSWKAIRQYMLTLQRKRLYVLPFVFFRAELPRVGGRGVARA